MISRKFDSFKVAVAGKFISLPVQYDTTFEIEEICNFIEYIYSLSNVYKIPESIRFIGIYFPERLESYNALLRFVAGESYEVKIKTYNMLYMPCLWVNDSRNLIYCMKRPDIHVEVLNVFS